MYRMSLIVAAAAGMTTVPAAAQMVDVPIYSNGILGQQALRNTYDNYNRAQGIDPERRRANARDGGKCSLASMAAADRRAMVQEYHRRDRADGRASADAWIGEQGARFRMKLVAEGICPPMAP